MPGVLLALNPWPDSAYLYRQYGPSTNAINARVFVPLAYDEGNDTKHPLVIFCHGDGEKQPGFVYGNPNVANSGQMSDKGQFEFVTTTNQAIFPCFLVLIQRNGPSNDVEAIANMITLLSEEFQTASEQTKIDLDRVTITGLSGGGGTTLRTANAHPELFACFVPLSPVGEDISNAVDLPMWFFHSYDDGTVTPANSEQTVQQARLLGGHPILTMYDTGGHSYVSWNAAYRTPPLIPWIASQVRGTPSTNNPATVTISDPTADLDYDSPTTNVTVSGTCAIEGSAAPEIESVLARKGTYPVVDPYNQRLPTTGTIANWSFTHTQAVNQYNPNPHVLHVVATGESWSDSLGGHTFYSDTIIVTKPEPADTTSPVVIITSPTVSSAYVTMTDTISLGGTATDNKGVVSVSWINSAGGSGTAAGTTDWTIDDIPLAQGSNVITVTAVDAANNTASDTLTVSYSNTGSNSSSQTIRFDFGASADMTTEEGWNNISAVFVGTTIADSIDADGDSTDVSLTILKAFNGINSSGSTSTTGAYPVSAIKDTLYVDAGVTAELQLSGLDPTDIYDFTFFASRVVGSSDRVTRYTIGTTSVTLDAAEGGGNSNSVVTITDVQPDSSGQVTISISPESGSAYGYLGVLEVSTLTIIEDTDIDGWPDSLEVLMGTSPTDPTDHFRARLSAEGSSLYFSYYPISENISIRIEWTMDLLDQDSWQTLDGLSFTDVDEEMMAALPSLASGGAVFYRAVVSE
ncbi:prolyl oligopeptidase family serine peptidase [Cerasicoccus frondis]|uniref:prolyl oligopeptidase family serine peptidase n=1 Tax=Cerasicoccus frondis TaxID=490090 RepID=UPI002852D4C9|nr:prolyl oligopeptidase family serine peptidase [Cerasicoccus frondis]